MILTSNLGSQYILEGITPEGEISEDARSQVDLLLKQQFRPEFLNRLDEIVFYKPLQKLEIFRILDLLVADLQKRLEEKQLTVSLSDSAKEFIVEEGFDPVYGARPLKRYLQSHVETRIARLLIEKDPEPGTHLNVVCENGELSVHMEPQQSEE